MFKNTYYRIRRWLLDIPYNTKRFYQRGKRGWSNSDSWGMNSYFLDIHIGMLDNVIEHGMGYPGGSTSYKQWVSIMKKIKKGFESKIKLFDLDHFITPDGEMPKNMYVKIKPNKDGTIPLLYTPEGRAYWDKCYYDKKLEKKWNREFKVAMELYVKWFDHLWD